MKKILTVISAALALSACGEKEGTVNAAPQPSPAAIAVPAPDPGYKPDKDTYFKLPLVSGGELDLASYSGKPVMVMFFTETCPYCRKAAPFVEKLHETYSGKGLNVVGINIRDSRQSAINFAEDFGLTFPMTYAGKGPYGLYKAQGVPYLYLLNRDHKVHKFWAGYTPEYDQSIFEAADTVLADK